MDAEQFLRLKKSLVQLKDQFSKSQGAREILLERLKNEFNSSSVVDAKNLLQIMTKELEEKNRDYQERCSSFERDLNQHANPS